MTNQPDNRIDHGRIAALLTQSAQHLDAEIVSALDESRSLALQRQRASEPAFSLIGFGHKAQDLLPHRTHQWVLAAIVLLVIVTGTAVFWNSLQERQNPYLAILTGDMPMDAYVDK